MSTSECPQDGCTAEVVAIQGCDAFIEWGRSPDGRWRLGVQFDRNPINQKFRVFCSAGHEVKLTSLKLPPELYQIVRQAVHGFELGTE